MVEEDSQHRRGHDPVQHPWRRTGFVDSAWLFSFLYVPDPDEKPETARRSARAARA